MDNPNTNFDIAKESYIKSSFSDPQQQIATSLLESHPLLAPSTGNHPYCMMTESLSLVYSFFRNSPILPAILARNEQGLNQAYLCSFYDLLPKQFQRLFQRTMLRSESLCLRYCGNSKLYDEDAYLCFIRSLIFAQPKRVVYRLLDYCDEFNFLDTDLDRSIRGVQRLLFDKDPNSNSRATGYLLRREIRILEAFLDSGRELKVLISFCEEPDHFFAAKDAIEFSLKKHKNYHNLQIGLSIENATSARELIKFTSSRHFFFAPSDLRASLQKQSGAGVSRKDVDVTQGKAEVVTFVQESIQTAIDQGLENVELLNCKILVGKMEQFKLPEIGVDVTDQYTPEQVVLPEEEKSKIEELCKEGVVLDKEMCEYLKACSKRLLNGTT